MKALFLAYSQAYNEEIIDLLEFFGQRGFTRWVDVQGRGSEDGLPHMGSYVWPENNHAMLVFVEDDDVADKILQALRHTDERTPDLGLRAFMWNIEKSC
jgi:hypothetical protein